MSNTIQEILEGWKNYTFPNPETENMAKFRLAICSTCPIFNNGYCSSKRSMKAEIDFKYKGEDRKAGETYKGCGCMLEVKGRSQNSHCPLGKW